MNSPQGCSWWCFPLPIWSSMQDSNRILSGVQRGLLYQHLSANMSIIFSFFCCSRFICFLKVASQPSWVLCLSILQMAHGENYHRKTWGIRWNILSRVGNKISGRKGNMRHFKSRRKNMTILKWQVRPVFLLLIWQEEAKLSSLSTVSQIVIWSLFSPIPCLFCLNHFTL